MIGRKKKTAEALENTSKKFTSNGSLLSQNGLKAAYSEPDMTQGGGRGGGGLNGAGGGVGGHDEGSEYVNIIEGEGS